MQSVAVITLGTVDLARSRRFYREGFGWHAVFENDEVVFYQLNGIVLGTWLKHRLEEDMQRPVLSASGAVALAHNVAVAAAVDALLDRLVEGGGTLLRPADAPPHGGYRGYVADPDGHAWEIAWNPGFALDAAGNVTFGL